MKAIMVILTVLSQQQGQVILAHLRRMARNTSDDSLVVHLLAALRERPTGVNDPYNSDMMRRIRNTIQTDVSSVSPAVLAQSSHHS